MPKSRAELTLQKVAIEHLTRVQELAKERKKTPQELLASDPILYGETAMLGRIFLTSTYDMNLDIPDHLIDQIF